MIQLTRPICFFDIESTGTDRENDRIVEISICKLFPDGSKEVKTRRVNPGMNIPPEATEVHKISDEDVANEPKFASIAKGMFAYIDGCDVAGFNSNSFDVPMLYNEFARCGITWDYTKFCMVDVGNLFKIFEPRTLSAGVKFYLGRDHEGAHGAEADAVATMEIFEEQLKRYNLEDKTVEVLQFISNFEKKMLDLSGKFVYNDAGDIVFNFGQKRGVVASTEPGLLMWMLDKDFSADTKQVCQKILDSLQTQP